MRTWLAAALILMWFGLAGGTWAQEGTSDQPPLFGSAVGGVQSEDSGDQQNDNFHILVIGDALGGGLMYSACE